MKKYIVTILSVLLLSVFASAAQVGLEWDANELEDEVQKYRVYEVINGTNTFIKDSLTNTTIIDNVTPGKHTYVVTAVNMWDESLPSNQASTAAVPKAPKGLRVIVIDVP